MTNLVGPAAAAETPGKRAIAMQSGPKPIEAAVAVSSVTGNCDMRYGFVEGKRYLGRLRYYLNRRQAGMEEL